MKFGLQRILFGIFQVINFQVNIQFRPIQMKSMNELDILD
jgi:hypothetical protein